MQLIKSSIHISCNLLLMILQIDFFNQSIATIDFTIMRDKINLAHNL